MGGVHVLQTVLAVEKSRLLLSARRNFQVKLAGSEAHQENGMLLAVLAETGSTQF